MYSWDTEAKHSHRKGELILSNHLKYDFIVLYENIITCTLEFDILKLWKFSSFLWNQMLFDNHWQEIYDQVVLLILLWDNTLCFMEGIVKAALLQ